MFRKLETLRHKEYIYTVRADGRIGIEIAKQTRATVQK